MEEKFRNELNANIKLSNLYKVCLVQYFVPPKLLLPVIHFSPWSIMASHFQNMREHLMSFGLFV